MVTIKDLSFSYPKQKVYDGFNLEVPDNQVCLVTGINGVGKSTLLRLIAGVLLPDAGEIIYDKRLGDNPRRKIGFISDKLSLYESLTVKRSIELHREVFGITNFDDSMIKFTKIRPEQKISELSIGQRTILHLSMVLSAEPEILLIDEIIHSIDAFLRNYFLQKIIKTLAERQMTVIMVNVNFHDIEHVVDRVILLRDGHILVDEPIDVLKEKVKKIVAPAPPDGLPIISRLHFSDGMEFFVYPFGPEYETSVAGEVVDLNLTEIVSAFIGGEYD